MLILVGVTVNVAMNGGLFNQAQIARTQTDKEATREQLTSVLVGALDSSGTLTAAGTINAITNADKDAIIEGTEFPLTVKYKGEEFIVTENGINSNVSKIIREGEYVAPIPDGYTASMANGENTIAGGLVIYEGTESVTNDNVETAKTTRNQFVWIPINNPNDMYGIDANGNKLGKLYNFDVEGNITNLNWTEVNEVMNWIDANSNKEPANLLTDYDNTTNLAEWTSNLYQNEFNNMVNSVIKYKGFYVGRYETGGFNGNEAIVRAGERAVSYGDTSISNAKWYKMYINSKTLSSDTTTSRMIWGCQWDAMIKWILAGEEKTKAISNNYIIDPIMTGGTNDKINNIYDLDGNVQENTQEVVNMGLKSLRGRTTPTSRNIFSPLNKDKNIGSRLTLYIN